MADIAFAGELDREQRTRIPGAGPLILVESAVVEVAEPPRDLRVEAALLRGAGLESLFTIKIGWSETDKFPHTRFWWEGIDGSRVLVKYVPK